MLGGSDGAFVGDLFEDDVVMFLADASFDHVTNVPQHGHVGKLPMIDEFFPCCGFVAFQKKRKGKTKKFHLGSVHIGKRQRNCEILKDYNTMK